MFILKLAINNNNEKTGVKNSNKLGHISNVSRLHFWTVVCTVTEYLLSCAALDPAGLGAYIRKTQTLNLSKSHFYRPYEEALPLYESN